MTMTAIPGPRSGASPDRPRELTGRTVLICLISFFAVVFAVNAVMVRAAVSTFGGVETASSYQAGLNFARDMAAARAQVSRHWRIDARLLPRPGAPMQIELSAHDQIGRPLAGLAATVILVHPTDRRLDRDVDMHPDGAGRFRGATAPAPGQWDLVIELARDDERLFRSRKRLTLR
jgi:nitrogen fixation protein FixH